MFQEHYFGTQDEPQLWWGARARHMKVHGLMRGRSRRQQQDRLVLHLLKLPRGPGNIVEVTSVNAMLCICTSPLPTYSLQPCLAERMIILKKKCRISVLGWHLWKEYLLLCRQLRWNFYTQTQRKAFENMSPAYCVSFESPVSLPRSQLLRLYARASVHSPDM